MLEKDEPLYVAYMALGKQPPKVFRPILPLESMYWLYKRPPYLQRNAIRSILYSSPQPFKTKAEKKCPFVYLSEASAE